MRFSFIALVFICFFIIIDACTKESIYENQNPYDDIDKHLTYIDGAPQRSGDESKGEDYLLNGNYVSSGIPADLFTSVFPEGTNLLNRNGKNEIIPFDYTQITHANGIEVVSPNCMQCHGGYVNDQFVVGLANLNADFTFSSSGLSTLLDFQIQSIYGADSPESEAFMNFGRAISATGDLLVTETVGANTADKLALVLGAHRDASTLMWLDEAQYEIPHEVIPADVPAWWLLKKKNAMFSTGIGRGDFARIMMASSVLTLSDTSEARIIDKEFVDVATYIRSLEAPVFPGEIDESKAQAGKVLFEGICSKCHGHYGDNESYPNVIVSHNLLQTDSLLAQSNFAYKEFVYWYNESWFSKGQFGGEIIPGNGYLAPPLDGVWATAPYLHNGSIPNLRALLDSSKRPPIWRRAENDNSYDFISMGINISTPTEKLDKFTYDVNIAGFGNKGHYFSDFMTDLERKQLLEYLKTL